MLNTINIPVFIPVIGIFILLIFIYFLYKINENLKQLKNSYQIPKVEKDTKIPNQKNIIDDEVAKDNIITSPMVGIVYTSSDPNKPAFIKEGDHFKQGDTLLLIEAMRTFNEVRAPRTGVIKQILIKNETPVEFGENLIIIE